MGPVLISFVPLGETGVPPVLLQPLPEELRETRPY